MSNGQHIRIQKTLAARFRMYLRELRQKHDSLALLSTAVTILTAGLCILPSQAACVGQVSGQLLQLRAAVTES